VSTGASTGNENAHGINVVCNVADWGMGHKTVSALYMAEIEVTYLVGSTTSLGINLLHAVGDG
jgi:hypothetical protein